VDTITVGHVEVDGLWVEIPAQVSMSVEEVIVQSGMSPRDGTTVRCFFTNGVAVSDGRVLPGETVVIGARPPPVSEINPLLHEKVGIRWARDVDRSGKRFNGSGWVGENCTLWVPGVVRGCQIRAVEISRKKNSNGKIHAQGYRVRSDDEPYQSGDMVLAASTGEKALKIFDPITGELSIDVSIIPNSMDAASKAEIVWGPMPIWVLKISGFDSSERTAHASVERSYTWWRKRL